MVSISLYLSWTIDVPEIHILKSIDTTSNFALMVWNFNSNWNKIWNTAQVIWVDGGQSYEEHQYLKWPPSAISGTIHWTAKFGIIGYHRWGSIASGNTNSL